jgi:hypothetical protein
LAIYVARVEEDEEEEGTALGGYAMLRTAESESREAELLSPGVSWIVNATWESSSVVDSFGASCRRR